MQFFITAYDGKDEGALDRRMSVRQQHIENIQKVKEYGSVISAGGILDDQGKMIGSFLIMEFATQALFDQYLSSEPYIQANVWQDIQVEKCNTVIINDAFRS